MNRAIAAVYAISIRGDRPYTEVEKDKLIDCIPALVDQVKRLDELLKRHPIPVTEIVAALERESANTDSDPRWLAAEQLRRMTGWETRTLMCRVDERPSTIESPEGKL